ncbi:MAG: 2-oxoacid:acceptor oxidoreductase subunit alpha [Theionarchaea archaeon]|nr:2-oxoacid:acceptor oxidoreductase subunit alpha [Theionarchaea archaeon]
MVFTFLVGGKAGEGVKKTGSVATRIFADMGRHVFEMDDYQSLIRGGHNFSVVTTSTREVNSHYMKADLVVCLDKRSYTIHSNHVAPQGTLIYNSDTIKGVGIGVPLTTEAKEYPDPSLMLGVGGVAILSAALGLDKKRLETVIQGEYPRGIEDNIEYASKIYDLVYPLIAGKYQLKRGDKKRAFLFGNQAIALGACCGGLDVYFAYPMTPSSSLLHYLAAHTELGITVVHPENEIAVMNMAIGAAFTGCRTMVGTSGGGFALMEEAFSLAGMTETPLLCVISSRPGPSTGVPTYTAQGDLRFALNQGHGEFPRIIASPGSIKEAFSLTAEMLDLVWKFQTPGIILTEKHLSESTMTVDVTCDVPWVQPLLHEEGEYMRYRDTPTGVSPLLFMPSQQLIKWNSYEHDEKGITTENPELIAKMQEKRKRKSESLREYLKNVSTVNVYGKGPVIFTYGSTTMSVLEALTSGDIEATVVQPRYLEPFPAWEINHTYDSGIVIEMSSTGLFASLLKEKGIKIRRVITKYDGRPFDPVELASRIKEVI